MQQIILRKENYKLAEELQTDTGARLLLSKPGLRTSGQSCHKIITEVLKK